MCFQGSQCNNRITDSSHNWAVAVRIEVISQCMLLMPSAADVRLACDAA
jgi:hypothetical protein